MTSGSVETGRAHVSVTADGKAAARQVQNDFNRAMPQIGRNAGNQISSGLFARMQVGSRGVKASIAGIVGLAGGAAAALGTVASAGALVGLKTAAGLENAKIGFTTMLGSASKADKFLKDLSRFAAKTPFEFPELQTAASSLISVGVQSSKVIPIMTTLGNVTSGMGTGSEGVKRATVALQQMQSAGRITAEDLNQLRDAGIPLNSVMEAISAQTGQSTKKLFEMSRNGKLGRKELDALMVSLQSGKGFERFNGLMDAQSKSLAGMWSTLKDTLGQGLAKAIQPALPAIKAALGGITSFIGVALAQIPKVITFLRPAVLAVKAFFAAFREGDVTSDGLVGTFERAGVAVRGIVPVLRTVASFIMNQVVPGFLSLVAVVRQWYATIIPIVIQIVRVILDRFNQMRPEIMSIWTSVKTIITGVMFIVREVISSVTHIVQMIWARWGNQIKAVVSTVFGAVVKIISGVMKAIAGIIKLFVALIKGDWKGAWNAIKQIFSGVWQAIKGILTLATAVLRATLAAWWAKVRALWTSATTAVRNTWNSFWTAIRTATSNAVASLLDKVRTVLDKVKSAFSTAKDNIRRIWEGLKDIISKPVQWIVDHVYNKPLVPVWNRVAGLVNGPKLSAYAKGTKHAAAGWALVGEEGPEFVRFKGGEQVLPHGKEPAQGGAGSWLKGLASSAIGSFGNLAGRMKDWVLGGLRAAAGKILNPVKSLIDRAMPSSGVGKAIGGIGHKAVDLILNKIKAEDVLPKLGGAPGSAIGTGGWASIYRALRAVGARNFTTYAGHDQGASRSRDITPPSQRIADTARRLSSIWYVIYNRRIASITHGMRWRPYTRYGANATPSQAHTNHVHVTLRPGVKAYAGGTRSASPGWAMVGERGPEWVNFRGGERVLPNGRAPGGAGGVNIYGGQFGYDPVEIAKRILAEQRHKEALNSVFA